LRRRQILGDVDRNFGETEFFSRKPAGVTDDDHAVAVNHDRLPPPEFPKRLGDRFNGAGVKTRVLLVGNDAANRPHFDSHRSAPWHGLLCWWLRGINEHVYYRCANNHPGPDHPKVRWKADDLEQAVFDDLASMRMPSPEIAAWFRSAIRAAVTDLTAHKRRQATALAKRKSELATMQDRLLNAYLTGTVEDAIYKAKSAELNGEVAKADEALAQLGDADPNRGETAVAIFDWAQHAAETWRGSNNALKRDILDSVCLNRTLGDVNLYTTKRKPFDVFAEGLNSTDSRGDRI
jgi:hypothetical protein